MKNLFIIVILILLFIPIPAQAQSDKYAVILSYDSQGSTKIWASSCARLLKDVLRDNGFAQKNIFIDTRATQDDLLEAIDWLKTVEASEIVVGIFGHGGGTGIVLKDSWISHYELKGLLSGLESEKQLIIIDTCGSGGAIIGGMDGISLNATNRIVLTSTSFESESSVFSGHLTDWTRAVLAWGLKEGNADFNGDGKVSIEEAGSVKGLISDGYEGEFFL
jgi:hypothetical protein